MDIAPHCPSTAALRSLLPRARVLVAAAQFASNLPPKLAKAVAALKGDILTVTVDTASLSTLIGQPVSFDDVAVFADGLLLGHVPRRSGNGGEAIASLIMLLINQNAATQKLRTEEAAFFGLVEATVRQAIVWVEERARAQAKPVPAVVKRDPYEVLNVKPGVSSKDLKRARDALLAITHSDRVEQLHPALRERATELTREILEAYNSLSKAKRTRAA